MSFSSDLKEELSKISNLNKKDEVKYRANWIFDFKKCFSCKK